MIHFQIFFPPIFFSNGYQQLVRCFVLSISNIITFFVYECQHQFQNFIFLLLDVTYIKNGFQKQFIYNIYTPDVDIHIYIYIYIYIYKCFLFFNFII